MSTAAVRMIRQLGSAVESLLDADLLTAFAAKKDADAFAAIVTRHGPSVFGVCRRILGHTHDAEDAFQAVFLVLALQAAKIRPPGSVGGWLYGVAVRTANKAKVTAARRRRREMIAAAQTSRMKESSSSIEQTELCSVLDQELAKLPDALRVAVVLCDLHGKTRPEAATELHCPEGTIAARLHRGRKKLALALSRRGLAVPAAGLATLLSPVVLSAKAIHPAVCMAVNSSHPSAAVQALAQAVIRSMKTTATTATLGIITFIAGGLLAAAGTGLLPVELSRDRSLPTASSEGAIIGVLKSEPEEPKPKPGDPPPVPATPKWREKAVLKHIEDLIFSVAYDPNGKNFSAGCFRGEVVTWENGEVNKPRTVSYDPIRGAIPKAVAYSPDGRFFAVSAKGGVLVQNPKTWKFVFSQKRDEMDLPVILEGNVTPTAIAFAPAEEIDAKTLNRLAMTDGHSIVVKTWLDDGLPSTAKFGPLAGAPKIEGVPPAGVAYSPDGKRLVFIPNYKMSPNGPIGKADPVTDTHWIAQVWGGGSGAPIEFLKHGTSPVTAVAWSPDGTIATGDAIGEIALWDGKTFKELRRMKIGGRGGRSTIHALAVTDAGKTLAAAVELDQGKNVNRVVFFDAATGERGQDLQNFPNAPPLSIAFSPDGKTMIVGCGYRDTKDRKLTPEEWKTLGEVRVFTTEAKAP